MAKDSLTGDLFRFVANGVAAQRAVDEQTSAYARHSDPETSEEAAKSIRITHLEAKALEGVVAAGARGVTSEELGVMLGIERVTISPRLRPLARKGFIIETDERRCGTSGRSSVVWKAKKYAPHPI